MSGDPGLTALTFYFKTVFFFKIYFWIRCHEVCPCSRECPFFFSLGVVFFSLLALYSSLGPDSCDAVISKCRPVNPLSFAPSFSSLPHALPKKTWNLQVFLEIDYDIKLLKACLIKKEFMLKNHFFASIVQWNLVNTTTFGP